ncbi:GxxExxY protein [Fuerstiella marisgermanici]|uniref:GxxExxY protein n=2 Tax=Fuerstiella marisgermanici TaxID=1891926 RepID=A0A1P8WPQ2_9PLAN|nr:GxxExxY protein [Fuerstiella marisgermanici]
MYEEESYVLRGAAFEVYKEKGCGFLEKVYQECIELELAMIQVPFVAKRPLLLNYKGKTLSAKYEPDLICFDKIIVELKAASKICDEHRAQLHNYLKATNLRLGFLMNFGHHPGVQIERIVR